MGKRDRKEEGGGTNRGREGGREAEVLRHEGGSKYTSQPDAFREARVVALPRRHFP